MSKCAGPGPKDLHEIAARLEDGADALDIVGRTPLGLTCFALASVVHGWADELELGKLATDELDEAVTALRMMYNAFFGREYTAARKTACDAARRVLR